eukprot:15467254-Alexandrium_andersonii.AAC.1
MGRATLGARWCRIRGRKRSRTKCLDLPVPGSTSQSTTALRRSASHPDRGAPRGLLGWVGRAGALAEVSRRPRRP